MLGDGVDPAFLLFMCGGLQRERAIGGEEVEFVLLLLLLDALNASQESQVNGAHERLIRLCVLVEGEGGTGEDEPVLLVAENFPHLDEEALELLFGEYEGKIGRGQAEDVECV